MKVCEHCFNDAALKSFIKSNSSTSGSCDFCRNELITDLLEIEELLDFFSELFDIFEISEDGSPLLDIITEDWDLVARNCDGNKLIQYILDELKYKFSNPLQLVIYNNEICNCVEYWNILKEKLKWENRFIGNLDSLIDLGWDGFFNQQSTLNHDGLILYRSRLHNQSGENPYSKDNMGHPSKELASAGRANPKGIPYLYLSFSLETTLYESRATFLDEISIGNFEIVKDENLVLVDFTEEPTLFDNINKIEEYVKSQLLKSKISKDLSKPIRRYDSDLEYVPTQFICEFIRYITGADGIIFNSSLHKEGKNVVLFDQNKVECVKVEKHHITKIQIESKNV